MKFPLFAALVFGFLVGTAYANEAQYYAVDPESDNAEAYEESLVQYDVNEVNNYCQSLADASGFESAGEQQTFIAQCRSDFERYQ